MGNFANTLFSSLLGWLRNAAAWLWSFLNDPESGGFIIWMADNWLPLVIALCAACMLIDFLVYLLRWQPYKVWASFFRRIFGRDAETDDSQRIRRRWIHADGTTSIEEVDVAEVMPEPEPAIAFAAPSEEDTLSARYARFARPQTEPVFAQPPVDEPQPEPAFEEPPVDAERSARPVSIRRRRYTEPVEELPLRYSPPPTSDDAPAYHEPYYPPQWKRPADTGSSSVDLGGSGL